MSELHDGLARRLTVIALGVSQQFELFEFSLMLPAVSKQPCTKGRPCRLQRTVVLNYSIVPTVVAMADKTARSPSSRRRSRPRGPPSSDDL